MERVYCANCNAMREQTVHGRCANCDSGQVVSEHAQRLNPAAKEVEELERMVGIGRKP